MIKTLLKIAWWAESSTCKLTREGLDLAGKIFYKIVKLICISLIESICFICFKVLHINPKPLVDDGIAPIVSLTSFPARINSVWLVLLSMFLQTYRPAKILLVLTEEEFPNGKSMLPSSLLRFEKLGVEIVFQSFNLKPHNKYFYALSHIKDRPVITVDDDLFYWLDTILWLIKMHEKYPNHICTNASYQIIYNNGVLLSAKNSIKQSNNILAMGVGGVLYPTIFRPEELFNKKIINKFLLLQDDNWLKIQQMLCGINVHTEKHWVHPLPIIRTQKIALYKQNVIKQKSGNCHSVQLMQKAFEYYGFNLDENLPQKGLV